MKKYTIREGQSLLDVALQEFGAINGVFQILADNSSLELNSQVVAGDSILIDDTKSNDLAVREHFRKLKYRVNTGGSDVIATVAKIHDASHDSSHN